MEESSNGMIGGRLRIAAYFIAYIVALLAFSLAWLEYPGLLYIGRDGDLALWISNAYREWAGVLDVTAINPLQGMTSMLVAINPYFNPAEWVFWTDLPHGAKLVISFVVYFMEVTLSTFVLGLALGFSRLFSFTGSIWLALLLFPPFNFMFGLQGWLATAPLYGHTLALSNLTLFVFTKIGEAKWSEQGLVRAAITNWLLATCIFALVLLNLLVAPFYNGGLLIGSVLVGGIVFLSSSSRQQFFWRLLAGVYVALCGYLLGFLEFYSGARSYTARFADVGSSLPLIRWPVDLSPAAIANAKFNLCNWGVACDSLPWFPLAINSYWLHVAVIGGGLALWARMPRPLSRIGLYFAGMWLALLVWWALASIGVVPLTQFGLVYYFLMMFPFLAFFSLYAIVFLLGWGLPANLLRKLKVAIGASVTHGVAAGAIMIALMIVANSATLHRILRYSHHRSSTPIVDVLSREIALRPGELYRGSVATILGGPGGSLRPLLGLSPNEPLRGGQFESFLRLAAESGSSHDLLDLWWWNIPTLSEYGQGVSRPLMFYMSNFLSSPGDATELNFALPRAANIDVLRAMGVRFIITDTNIFSNRVSKRSTLPLKQGAYLNLYEIADPNVGTYSPTELRVFSTAQEFVEQVSRNPGIFETRAYVNSPVERKLVPAKNARMIFEKGGLHVMGTSDGASALLLPVQFSHCYRLLESSGNKANILRANIIQTLVLFEGELDVHLRWEFGFWGRSECRLQDVKDLTPVFQERLVSLPANFGYQR
jgi:hypothetical protein